MSDDETASTQTTHAHTNAMCALDYLIHPCCKAGVSCVVFCLCYRELEGSITHLEEGVLSAEDEILRLQGAVSDLAADRDAADERARLNEEAAAREIEDLREAQTEMHERHVKELKDIRARVRRAVEAKEKERADLAERLHAAEQKMAETDAVLQRAKLDIGTL